MKYILTIVLTVLIIYLFQTTINNENRIINLERRIIELEYKQIELKKELSRAKIRKVMISANCNCWLCEE